MWRYLLILALLVNGWSFAQGTLSMEEKLNKLKAEEEDKTALEFRARVQKFYDLKPGETLRDITDELLASPDTKEVHKNAIQSQGRRVYIFDYPSGPHRVKGFISLIPDGQSHPLLVYLRGGNRLFGMPFPGSDIACARDYTILATTYRGGVSEGQDEYGGAEVEDVKNLVDFIPELEQTLHQTIASERFYMLGASRGGMEMFLALARYPELQQRALKVVSLCGLLDMRATFIDRPDLKEMFAKEFGYKDGEEGEAWIDQRDPMLAVEKLRKDLPIYIIQASADLRVELNEGYKMVRKLEEQGNAVSYVEVPNAEHCLYGRDDRVDIIFDWLEQNS